MRKRFAMALAAALPSAALAQALPPPLTPGLLERIAPATPPHLAPSLQPPTPEAVRGPNEQARLRIGSVRLSGNTALSDAALLPILQPLVGQEVTLAQVEEARIAMVSAYGRAGYPFVTVSAGLTPAADGAELVMAVVEGRIAAVKLDGNIGPAGTQVLRFLNRLVDGGPVTTRALERALLLAGDVPGVTVRSVVRPLAGGEQGALELVAQVSRRPFSGYLSVDNRGYKLTGPVQGLLVVGANSFTSLGERIEASLFMAQDSEQTFGQVSAEAFAGSSGLRVRVFAGAGISRPGSPLSALGYRGYTRIFGLSAGYPIIRSRSLNLFIAGQFDALDSEIELGSGPINCLERRGGV